MTQIILTGSGTWNLPADWNDADNTIEMYGPGGNGATSGSSSFSGGGGGGGAYIKAVNVPLKASDLAGYVTSKSFNADNNYTRLWFGFTYTVEGVRQDYYLMSANNGNNASGATRGFGGSGGTCTIANVNYIRTIEYGGDGGNGRASSAGSGGGGGGAGGPDGYGGGGGSSTSTNASVGRGGGAGGGYSTAATDAKGSDTGNTPGISYTSGGNGGTGGSANASGSPGVAAALKPPGYFSVAYVSETNAFAPSTLTHSYDTDTNILSFSIYGGGSSVKNRMITLTYQVYVYQSVNFAWNLASSTEPGDSGKYSGDFGSLFIDGQQKSAVGGAATTSGSFTISDNVGRWKTVQITYYKNNYDTYPQGADTFSGSIAFTGVVAPLVYSGGGGGGAGDGTSGTSGGAGGAYGGGGGGSGSATNSVRGLGAPGIIVINYTPIVTRNSNFFMFF